MKDGNTRASERYPCRSKLDIRPNPRAKKCSHQVRIAFDSSHKSGRQVYKTLLMAVLVVKKQKAREQREEELQQLLIPTKMASCRCWRGVVATSCSRHGHVDGKYINYTSSKTRPAIIVSFAASCDHVPITV